MTPFTVPSGAIDAHVHIFDPARFPLRKRTPYSPVQSEHGSVTELRAVLDAHGLHGAVLVNPTSGYGDDNACMLDAVARGGGRFRGVARVAPGVTRARLQALAAQGVAGVRIDLCSAGTGHLADPRVARLIRLLADLDMVLQVQCEGDQPSALALAVRGVPVRMVIDHCGRPDPAAGIRQSGFQALLKLADTHAIAVKLSGPFRFSRQPYPHADADRYARALIAAYGPGRCMWGSDWPFLRLPRRMDYGPALMHLARWIPDARMRRKVLVDTPREWFGFSPIS